MGAVSNAGSAEPGTAVPTPGENNRWTRYRDSLSRSGIIAAVGEVIGLAGLVSLILAWLLPWGVRYQTWDMWGWTSNPESGHVLALLALLTAGYLLAITFAAPATFSAGPVRKWIKKQPAARSEQAFPGMQSLFIAWGAGCAIWADRVLAVQYVPRWGGFAVYFAGIALALAAALFWLAENKLIVRARWAATIVVVALFGTVLVGQGGGWLTRHVVTHTTSAAPITEVPPSTLAGVAWERPLAAGESVAGDAGGRIILTLSEQTPGGCALGIIGVDPVTGEDAWRFVTLGMPRVDCGRVAAGARVEGSDRAIQFSPGFDDQIYLDPATGQRLDQKVPWNTLSYLGELAVSINRSGQSPRMTVASTSSGDVMTSRMVPQCADGAVVDVSDQHSPGPAPLLDATYPDIAFSSEILALPVACFAINEPDARDLGVWIVNLQDPAQDRVVWVTRVPIEGAEDFTRPLIAGNTVIVSGPTVSNDTMTYAVDWRTGEGLWARTDLKSQIPALFGDSLLFPNGLVQSIPEQGLESADDVPVVVDAATGVETSRWPAGSGEKLGLDVYRVSTFVDGKAYHPTGPVPGAGVEVTDLTNGNTLSRVDLGSYCDELPEKLAIVGLSGGTAYCVVDFAQPSQRIVGVR